MSNKSKAISGIILILIGFILLGRTFDLFYFSFGDFVKTIFPLALILIGIWLIFRKRNQSQAQTDDHFSFTYQSNQQFSQAMNSQSPDKTNNANYSAPPRSDNFARQQEEDVNYKTQGFSHQPSFYGPNKSKYDKFIGDMYVDLNNVNMQNVEVSMFLGDLEIKLHGCILNEGLNRLIVSSFIGDIRIFIPKDMAIFIHSSNFAGDIELFGKRTGGFGNNVDSQTPNYSTATQKLYIAGNNFIGDIKVFFV